MNPAASESSLSGGLLRGTVQHKPIPARDLTVEPHNVTMLMADLAYSTLPLNDRELAEEVIELEGKYTRRPAVQISRFDKELRACASIVEA